MSPHSRCELLSSIAWPEAENDGDRKSTRLNSSDLGISYAGFCWKKKDADDAARVAGRSGAYGGGGRRVGLRGRARWAGGGHADGSGGVGGRRVGGDAARAGRAAK